MPLHSGFRRVVRHFVRKGLLFALASFLFSSNLFAIIKVGAWNIGSGSTYVGERVFGDSKGVDWPQVRRKIAETAIRYDMIFFQEIETDNDPQGCDSFTATGGDQSTTGVCNLLNEMNTLTAPGTYALDVSTNAGGGERYMVAYKASLFTINHSFVYSDPGGDFSRPPHIVNVTTGSDTFYVVNIHTSPSQARNQIWALPKVANDLENGTNIGSAPADPDIIILGDFNADGSYFTPLPSNGGDWVQFFNTFQTAGYQNFILENETSGDDTNLSYWSQNVYDRITVSPTLVPRVVPGSAEVFYYTGDVNDNCNGLELQNVLNEGCNGSAPTDQLDNATFPDACPYTLGNPITQRQCYDAAKIVSDHFPVSIELTMGAPDTTPPNFVSGTPSGIFVPWDTTVLDLTFNEPMDSASFTAGTVTISGGGTATFSSMQGSNVARFTISLPSAATTHTVTISGPRDLAGNSVNTPANYNFTTIQPPTVVISEVGNGSVAANDYILDRKSVV